MWAVDARFTGICMRDSLRDAFSNTVHILLEVCCKKKTDTKRS